MTPAPVVPGLASAPAPEGTRLLCDLLRACWAGLPRCVLLAVGFGDGSDFLAAWQAWRDDAARCDRLVFVAVEPHPPTAAGLAAAHHGTPLTAMAQELAAAWPPRTPNIHRLPFDGGRVLLLLALGPARPMLRALSMRAHVLVLAPPPGDLASPGSAGHDPHLAKALGRCAAPNATLLLAGDHARAQRLALATAGFVEPARGRIDGRPGVLLLRHQSRPSFKPGPAPGLAVAGPRPQRGSAIVIGAGLAGAFTASALADEGWAVSVLDRHAAPAQETSAQAAGIFHGTVHAADGTHARLLRAAALCTERRLRPLLGDGTVPGVVPGAVCGLLRLDARPVAALQAIIAAQGLPAGWVQALDAAQAGGLAGVPLPAAAWWFPGGGWVAPGPLVARLLQGCRFIGQNAVHALRQAQGRWQALDAAGQVLANADAVVLASADDAARLLAPLSSQRVLWPLQRVRGQTSGWRGAATALAVPVAGDGYAVPLAGGGLLCGASSSPAGPGTDAAESSLLPEDAADNWRRLQRLTALVPPPAGRGPDIGRVGWRVVAPDKLPVAGPVPLASHAGRGDQVRLWPRVEGLYVCTALGGRGITLAPLLGRLLASQIAGSPLPLEQDLVDAVDPARWLVRQARRERG